MEDTKHGCMIRIKPDDDGVAHIILDCIDCGHEELAIKVWHIPMVVNSLADFCQANGIDLTTEFLEMPKGES